MNRTNKLFPCYIDEFKNAVTDFNKNCYKGQNYKRIDFKDITYHSIPLH